MSEEKKEAAPAAQEEKKNPILHKCNQCPALYLFIQNSGEFVTFEKEEDMKGYILDIMKEMPDVFKADEFKDKPFADVLKEYDSKFFDFLKIVQKAITERKDIKEEIKIDPKYNNFDRIGRIITNFSVVSVPVEGKEGVRIVISKSLFYHYLELMAACQKMGILELSAVFSTASYSDGSLTVSFDDKIPKEQRKVDFVKPFFVMGVDGISKGISFQFVDARNQTEPEQKTDKKPVMKEPVGPESEKKEEAPKA